MHTGLGGSGRLELLLPILLYLVFIAARVLLSVAYSSLKGG